MMGADYSKAIRSRQEAEAKELFELSSRGDFLIRLAANFIVGIWLIRDRGVALGMQRLFSLLKSIDSELAAR
jgi:hypothetical protein